MKCFWLLLLLGAPSWGQLETRVAARINTVPAAVEVYQEVSGPQPRYLGNSDQTLWLDGRVSRVSLVLKAPGYHEEHLQLAPGYFYTHPVWPEQGALRLRSQPRLWWLGLLGMGLAAGLWFRRRGNRVGPYRKGRLVGQGSTSSVYQALRPGRTEPVALKLFDEGHYLVEEVARLMRLQHPNIVRLLDYGYEGTQGYLAMELVAGGTLRDRHPWPRPQVRVWLEQLGLALCYAHRHGVVHGDLKLEHLLLDESGALKVSDFGLRADQLGTPGYLAPERALGQPPQPATDQYAVGVIAYELLTGERPHAGGLHAFWQVPAHHPELSTELLAVLRRMLEREPGARYPELSQACEEICRLC